MGIILGLLLFLFLCLGLYSVLGDLLNLSYESTKNGMAIIIILMILIVMIPLLKVLLS